MANAVYDSIGQGYANLRQPDPRIAAAIRDALAGCRTVLNVGAGAGSYEPDDRPVVALEPSRVMLAQRSGGPMIEGVAERLPFRDQAFDAALAILTIHHWTNREGGLAEMRRVARRTVIFGWDPAAFAEAFWLIQEYLPEVDAVERTKHPTAADLASAIGGRVIPVPVPRDCTDGFFGAYWARPERYLDPAVRAAISGLALFDQAIVERAMDRLANDLATGRWDDQHGDLRYRDELDLGYRLIVADSSPSSI